jgi:glycosyltransferase involved in cell wall biosynthesis
MKVLYITGSMPPLRCGIGYYSTNLLKNFGGKNKVTVLTTERSDYPENNYATVKSWGLLALPKLLSTIKSLGPDVISLQYPAAGYKRQIGINLLPYFLRNTPVVLTLHEYHGSPLLGKIRDFVTALPVQKIIVSNPYDMGALPRILRRKATIVPIGSNIERVLANPATFEGLFKTAGFSRRKPVGVFFGFAFANKGLDLLLSAVARSKSQLLLLTGLDESNPYQAKLLLRIAEINANGGKVYCAGFLDDKSVSEALQECDYFVLPQPLPLTAKSGTTIAAVMHKLPIVSTGANDKKLNHPYANNENSMLLNPMNLETLSNTLRGLDESPDRLVELKKGVSGIREYFDWTKIAEAHETIWKEVISEE